jgi:hypothetical protein
MSNRPASPRRRFFACSIGVALLVAGTSHAVAHPAEKLIEIPFIGCASDGQMGPVTAPASNRNAPRLPPASAGELACHASAALGVIVPRGWHCFGLYGSSGVRLLVTPQRHDAADLFRSESEIRGAAPAGAQP